MTTRQFPSQSQQQQVPRTAAELAALEARRDELSSQFEAVTERRGRLAQERLNAEARANAGGKQDLVMVKELEQQVTELGQRSLRIQRELTGTEDAIAAARARGVGADVEVAARAGPGLLPPPALPTIISVPPRGGTDADLVKGKYEQFLLLEALGFVLLGIIGGRLLWRAAIRSASRATQVPGMTNMQQSLDAIAVEVERISENQRYVTKMLTEGAPGEKAAVARDKLTQSR